MNIKNDSDLTAQEAADKIVELEQLVDRALSLASSDINPPSDAVKNYIGEQLARIACLKKKVEK